MNISVVTWGASPDGHPCFLLTDHEVTQEQYDDGEHYEMAEQAALELGFETPLVHIDENDAAACVPWLFENARKTDAEWTATNDDWQSIQRMRSVKS
jgi:hypothetical protein